MEKSFPKATTWPWILWNAVIVKGGISMDTPHHMTHFALGLRLQCQKARSTSPHSLYKQRAFAAFNFLRYVVGSFVENSSLPGQCFHWYNHQAHHNSQSIDWRLYCAFHWKQAEMAETSRNGGKQAETVERWLEWTTALHCS